MSDRIIKSSSGKLMRTYTLFGVVFNYYSDDGKLWDTISVREYYNTAKQNVVCVLATGINGTDEAIRAKICEFEGIGYEHCLSMIVHQYYNDEVIRMIESDPVRYVSEESDETLREYARSLI